MFAVERKQNNFVLVDLLNYTFQTFDGESLSGWIFWTIIISICVQLIPTYWEFLFIDVNFLTNMNEFRFCVYIKLILLLKLLAGAIYRIINDWVLGSKWNKNKGISLHLKCVLVNKILGIHPSFWRLYLKLINPLKQMKKGT